MTDDGMQLNDPQALYRTWEGSQWSPFTIDLAEDRGQWRAMGEADRALTYRFVSGFLDREGLLPGFARGYSLIHHDATRHIGYGVWFLREAVRDDPAAGDAVRGILRELLPSVAESLDPGEARAATPPTGSGSAPTRSASSRSAA